MSSGEQDFGPVGRKTDFGAEGEPNQRPHLHVHVAAGTHEPRVVAPSQVPPSRQSASQTRLERR